MGNEIEKTRITFLHGESKMSDLMACAEIRGHGTISSYLRWLIHRDQQQIEAENGHNDNKGRDIT